MDIWRDRFIQIQIYFAELIQKLYHHDATILISRNYLYYIAELLPLEVKAHCIVEVPEGRTVKIWQESWLPDF